MTLMIHYFYLIYYLNDIGTGLGVQKMTQELRPRGSLLESLFYLLQKFFSNRSKDLVLVPYQIQL